MQKGQGKRQGKSQGKGKLGGSKGKASSTFDAQTCEKQFKTGSYQRSGRNDISWYNKYPELLNAAGRIPFPYRPGMTVTAGSTTSGGTSFNLSEKIPGVLALEWLPSIGWSNNVTDPASVAAKELYAQVRSKFSGSLDADAPDFMVYMVCLDSIFSYIGALKRIYRILDEYSPHNYVMPDTLLQSMGLSNALIQNLRENKADFLYGIYELIRLTGKFHMPDVMDYYRRHYWMNDNVYTDRSSINGQFYVFVQGGFYQFAMLEVPETTGITAGGAKMVAAPWGSASYTNLLSYGRSLINSLSESDDAYTISGYLMRAYESAAQFIVSETDVLDPFKPKYEEEVLMQIENSRALGVGTNSSAWVAARFNVAQNPNNNTLIHEPYFVTGVGVVDDGGRHILNIRNDVPSVEEVVEASRLHPNVVLNGSNLEIHPSSEIPMRWTLWGADVDAYSFGGQLDMQIAATAVSAWNAANKIAVLASISQFDWHPLIWLLITSPAGGGSGLDAQKYTQIFGDLTNLTTLLSDSLENLTRVCLYSEFNSFT